MIYLNKHFKALGYHEIIEKLQGHALSERAKDTLGGLEPYMNEEICVRKMEETTAARRILDSCGSPPLPSMTGLEEVLTLADSGAMLVPEQLMRAVSFTISSKQVCSYLKRGESVDLAVASYGRSIMELQPVREEIERCVRGDSLYDDASPALRDVRKKLIQVEAQIKEKLNHILKSRKEYLADDYIATRNGQYVLPVKRKYQSQFGGTVVEVSGKGATVFMQPSAIAKLQAEQSVLTLEEDSEIRRILYTLTALVSDWAAAFRRNMEAMEILDVLFAKAKLSAAMHAHEVEIGSSRMLCIKKGRHPLLDAETCVPLDFEMDAERTGVIITGPNTGGKTVALKTVGLLSLMAQSGLHIPCAKGSVIAMRDAFWCDIGDSQSITQNLSTFSGHMTNIIDILKHASPDSFVLLDELGSGTDPAEGMGIAVAVLSELQRRGCMFLVTTHYAEVKQYAEETDGIVSARMAFDKESLQPMYVLEMGKTGESCALYIAQKLGLPQHLLEQARFTVYGGEEPVRQKAMRFPKSRLIRALAKKESVNPVDKFSIGDSVVVLPAEEIGIVYRGADENGDVIVQVKGVKRPVRHTRLRLKAPASELYPPDYDFSIVFDTAENRKARKQMGKRHDPTLSITVED